MGIPLTNSKSFIQKYFWQGIIVIVLIGGIANALVWFWPRQNSSTLELPSYPVEQVALGQTIFQANCSSCHGVDGSGYAQENIPAPAVNGTAHAWHHTDAQISGWIRDGVGQMPAIGTDWSDDEIDAVLSYIKQWWGPDELSRQTINSRLNP